MASSQVDDVTSLLSAASLAAPVGESGWENGAQDGAPAGSASDQSGAEAGGAPPLPPSQGGAGVALWPSDPSQVIWYPGSDGMPVPYPAYMPAPIYYVPGYPHPQALGWPNHYPGYPVPADPAWLQGFIPAGPLTPASAAAAATAAAEAYMRSVAERLPRQPSGGSERLSRQHSGGGTIRRTSAGATELARGGGGSQQPRRVTARRVNGTEAAAAAEGDSFPTEVPARAPRRRGGAAAGACADVLYETTRGPRAEEDQSSEAARLYRTVSAEAAAVADIVAVVRGEMAAAAAAEAAAAGGAAAVRAALLSGQSLLPLPAQAPLFFVVKSYSEEDVHKALKYQVWSSTPAGNLRLDAGYAAAQAAGRRLFLLFSVNSSGHFCGVAEMASRVDLNAPSAAFWQQAKWSGQLSLRWHCVKDVPNSALRHILLQPAAGEDCALPPCLLGKAVTFSRDTQQIPAAAGLELLRVFLEHPGKTTLLDDFCYYGRRERERVRSGNV